VASRNVNGIRLTFVCVTVSLSSSCFARVQLPERDADTEVNAFVLESRFGYSSAEAVTTTPAKGGGERGFR
jgi:hypothetical protein